MTNNVPAFIKDRVLNPDSTRWFHPVLCVLQFPYCDGAHAKHNEETGDNVGPLIIKKKDV